MARKYWYQEAISHAGLNKYKVIKAENRKELQRKVALQKLQWEEQWIKKVEQEQRRLEREQSRMNIEQAKEYAAQRTAEAEEIQEKLDQILLNSLPVKELDCSTLKDYTPFQVPQPREPEYMSLPVEPLRSDPQFNPKPSLGIRLSKKKLEEFENSNQEQFDLAHSKWVTQKEEILLQNSRSKAKYMKACAQWQQQELDYYKDQEEANAFFDEISEGFEQGEISSVEGYFKILLEKNDVPFEFSNSVDVEYRSETQMVIIDAMLPTIEQIPNLKSVSYVQSRKEMKETFFSDSYMKKKYDGIIYQMVLSYLNQVLDIGSRYDLVESAVLNGRVHTIDLATGQEIEPCILSISVKAEDIQQMNLNLVDAKTWFKKAKGVSAVALSNVTPVAPIVNMNKEDKRFIEGYSVVDTLDDSVNLAAMDWQDFENLIRDLFEEEFRATGGEVKITQASRDKGVDAVAFDPDPIRGGKIVIQAKRYTNVVGVSAVRDLYGTVMNEGATKGILVTTSNFGNDAYDFVKDKPLTLLNGGELLYLLEKHGHKAKIDIREAKKLLEE